jgi:hypothetical protein
MPGLKPDEKPPGAEISRQNASNMIIATQTPPLKSIIRKG